MRIIQSDSNKNVFNSILNDVAKKAEDNTTNFILLVPEKYSFTIEKLILLKSKRKALTNVSVITPSRLLYKLEQKSNNYIPKETGIMIVKKLILENINNLSCFKKTAKTLGFASKVYDTISELKNSGVSYKCYNENLSKLQSLNLKLKDIFLLYQKYEEFLATNKLIDACDRFGLLADLVLTSELVKTSEFYIFGFDNMSTAGMQVFKNITKVAKSVTFGAIELSGKNNSYVYTPEFMQSLNAMCEQLMIIPAIIRVGSFDDTISNHIINNLFAYPYTRKTIDDQISLIEFKSAEQEVKFVAENIKKDVIENKLRFNDIAIACSDINLYKPLFKSVFSDYEIPYFIDQSEKLASHPLVAFFVGVCNLYRRNFAGDDFILLFKNFFAGLNFSVANELENYIIKYGISYDKFKQPFVYGNDDKNEQAKSTFMIVETARIELVSKLLNIFDCFDQSTTASGYIKGIKLIFEEFKIDEKLKDFIQKLVPVKEFSLISLSLQIPDKINNILDEMQKILGDSSLDFDQFFAVFTTGLDSQTVSIVPTTIDCLFIGDVSLSKFYDYKNLYLIGASDGSVPKLAQDCGIILDAEINELAFNVATKIEPTIKTINKRERYKFISLVSCFTNKLVCSYPVVSPNGEEQKPSQALLDIAKIFIKKSNNQELSIKPINFLVNYRNLLFNEQNKNKALAYEFATKKVAENKIFELICKTKEQSDVVINSLFNYLSKDKKYNQGYFLDLKPKFNGKLLAPKQLFFTNGKTSISQLECYFSCPFKFFADYGLKVREREISDLGSIDFGNVLHKIAELYIKNIQKYNNIEFLDERQKKISAMIDYVFNQEKLQVATNKHVIVLLKKEAKRLIDALQYNYNCSNFKPIAEEFVFGENGKVNGIDLGMGITLEGKIDRIDKWGDYLRIIDYKTGAIHLSANNIYYGYKIQLFMYFNALRDGKNKLAGSFYFPIKDVLADEQTGPLSDYTMQGYFANDKQIIKNMDKSLNINNLTSKCIDVSFKPEKTQTDDLTIKPDKHILDEADLVKLSDYVTKISKKAIAEILDGYIAPSPLHINGSEICRYCKYNNACGITHLKNDAIRRAKTKIDFKHFIGGKN